MWKKIQTQVSRIEVLSNIQHDTFFTQKHARFPSEPNYEKQIRII